MIPPGCHLLPHLIGPIPLAPHTNLRVRRRKQRQTKSARCCGESRGTMEQARKQKPGFFTGGLSVLRGGDRPGCHSLSLDVKTIIRGTLLLGFSNGWKMLGWLQFKKNSHCHLIMSWQFGSLWLSSFVTQNNGDNSWEYQSVVGSNTHTPGTNTLALSGVYLRVDITAWWTPTHLVIYHWDLPIKRRAFASFFTE